MRATRLARYLAAGVFLACLLIPGSATAFSGTVLRGFGTATIDGVVGAGEWDPAGRVDFTVNGWVPGGYDAPIPATLFVMNDASNLYIGIRVQNETLDGSDVQVLFDNDHDDTTSEEGEDAFRIEGRYGPLAFYDGFVHETSPGWWSVVPDTYHGGTHDGYERLANGPGYLFYEFSHPLDSADNAHDFSLGAVRKIGFNLTFIHCMRHPHICAPASYFPSPASLAEIVIVSGSRVPPDTQITAGPREGTGSTNRSPRFTFTGTDDVLQSPDLDFECKIDEGAWEACTSPKRLDVGEGRHTLSVRAVDEMLLMDQSPAQRNWTVDHTPPTKPVIRGRRSVRQGQRVVLRFSARDVGIGGVYFKCSVDSRVLRRCPARYRVKLRPGRHLVRVRAYDRIGNRGSLTTVRVTVKRARR